MKIVGIFLIALVAMGGWAYADHEKCGTTVPVFDKGCDTVVNFNDGCNDRPYKRTFVRRYRNFDSDCAPGYGKTIIRRYRQFDENCAPRYNSYKKDCAPRYRRGNTFSFNFGWR